MLPFPAVTAAALRPIHDAILTAMPEADLRSPRGEWGVLALCCGAELAQSRNCRDEFLVEPEPPLPTEVSLGEISECALALADWLGTRYTREHERAQQYIDDLLQSGDLDPAEYRDKACVHWEALKIALGALPTCDEMAPIRRWAETHEDGWLVLLFVTGQFLDSKKVPWAAISSAVETIDPCVAALFAQHRDMAKRPTWSPERGRE